MTLIKIHSRRLGATCSFLKKTLRSLKSPTIYFWSFFFFLYLTREADRCVRGKSLKGSESLINEISEAAPLKKYHLESSGEKAAASMAWGRSGQRWRRGRGPLTLPAADTVQNTLPRNTRTVLFSSGHRKTENSRLNFKRRLLRRQVVFLYLYPEWWHQRPPDSKEAALGSEAPWTPTPAARRAAPDPAAWPGDSPAVYLNHLKTNTVKMRGHSIKV